MFFPIQKLTNSKKGESMLLILPNLKLLGFAQFPLSSWPQKNSFATSKGLMKEKWKKYRK